MSWTTAAQADNPNGEEHLLRCAYFSSPDTGLVQLMEFGTNQQDAINPIGPVTRVQISLVSAKNEIPFIRLANQKRPITSAIISEAHASVSFQIHNARVIGYSPLRQIDIHTYPSVELEVTSWTLRSPGILGFPKHREIECST
jgi:hypothetical protein